MVSVRFLGVNSDKEPEGEIENELIEENVHERIFCFRLKQFMEVKNHVS